METSNNLVSSRVVFSWKDYDIIRGRRRIGEKNMIVAFDLDGTLLDDQQRIPNSTIQLIQTLQEQGKKIAVATGRSYSACKYYAKMIGADYIVSCNGALVVDEKEKQVLFEKPVPKGTATEILTLLYNHHEKLKIQWDSHNTYYTNNILPFEQEYVDAFLSQYPEETFDLTVVEGAQAFSEFAKRPDKEEEIYQIFTFSMVKPPVEYHQILNKLRDFEEIQYVDFKSNYTDVTHSSVSKGKALDLLAQRNDLSPEKVMAFGDHHNDASMLSYAGISVAMGNADAEIKALAKYVTIENSQNGVEHFLKQFFKM